ncbi:MAG: hypothetical protein OHK0023_18060 [Anaerolineae bacterium]
MGRYFSLALVIFGALVQSSLVPLLWPGDIRPDLVLIMALAWMLLAGVTEGLLWAVVGGVLQDWLNQTPTGTMALALVAACGAALFFAGQITRANWVLPPLIALGGTLIYYAALVVLLVIIRRPMEIGYVLRSVVLPCALLNAFGMLILYRLLGVIYAIARPNRIGLSGG